MDRGHDAVAGNGRQSAARSDRRYAASGGVAQIRITQLHQCHEFLRQAYAANGDKEKWSIPVARNWEDFADAESVDGKIMLLSIQREGSLHHLSLINMRGETLHKGQLLTYNMTALWDPSRHEVLCLPTQYSPAKPDSTLPVWNYESNSVQDVVLHR